jgi:thiol-disulfide isomerase/thioredoxin
MKKIVYIVLGALFLTGCSVTPIKDVDNNANRFKEEYSNIEVLSNNPIVYKTDEEIIEILKTGTGIIYFGFPECPWCQSAVPVLISAAQELNVEEVYYFNPKQIREEETDTYKQIVELLGDNLIEDENGNKRLYVPDVYFVSKGKIIGHNLKTVESQINPSENPLTDDQKLELKNLYKELIRKTYNIK